ncbi:MAG: dTMP kinase [Chloroflexota bacterium]
MGIFITFEGPDGSGKSTQIERLAHHLQQQGKKVCCTREPGGTDIGEKIRELLHDVKHIEMAPLAEILLYSASRAQLVQELVQPKLANGYVVICDRYADSTYAYQGHGRGLDLATLKLITKFATNALQPDLTIFLDVPVEVGLTRKQQANEAGQGEWNRMDQLTLDFHQRVREGYLALAHENEHPWYIIDATQTIEDTHHAICAAVSRLQTS